MNVLKERRERRKDRMSGGSLESMESNYNSQNTNDAVTLSNFIYIIFIKIFYHTLI